MSTPILLFAAALLAPPPTGQTPDLSDGREIVFDDPDALEGETARPDHEPIGGRRGPGHGSLLQLRQHFVDRLIAQTREM